MVLVAQLGKFTKKIIELYAWNGWILWYVKYVSRKLFLKSPEMVCSKKNTELGVPSVATNQLCSLEHATSSFGLEASWEMRKMGNLTLNILSALEFCGSRSSCATKWWLQLRSYLAFSFLLMPKYFYVIYDCNLIFFLGLVLQLFKTYLHTLILTMTYCLVFKSIPVTYQICCSSRQNSKVGGLKQVSNNSGHTAPTFSEGSLSSGAFT